MNESRSTGCARSTWVATWLFLCLAAPGCGGGEDTTPPTHVQITGGISQGESVSGRRTLQATAEDDSGSLVRVEFYVSDTRVCAEAVTRKSGETFSCEWDSSTGPQGAQTLTAKALDAAGNSAVSEPIAFTLLPPNRAPTITQVTATPASINEGSSTLVSVSATDPDGDPLTYSFSQLPLLPSGTFGTETGSSRTWTAPFLPRNTTFTLKVTVSDGRGGTAESSVSMPVTNVASLNHPPVVGEISPDPTSVVVAGDTVTLFVSASDADGDTITYSWKTNPAGQGIFTTPTESVARWRSADLSTATTASIQVTVSDGTDSVTRSAQVQVRVPTYAQDIEPIWSPTCTTCHSGSSAPGALNLAGGSSYASIVNKNSTGTCSSLKRVQPGQPDDSVLVLKISDTTCGGRMPQLDSGYFDRNPGELTRIRSWILAGALNN